MADQLTPISNDDVVWMEEPEMGFWESTFLPAIFSGLKNSLRHVTDFKPVTQQYPEEKPDLPLNYRGVHRLNRDDKGRVKCVACMMCSTACPARCIEIVAEEAPKDDPLWADRDKRPKSFVIDELKCIYCGMCEEACPVDSIELTHIYDLTGMTRQEMKFNKEKLLEVFDQTKDNPRDPIRTHRGILGPASDFTSLPQVGPATQIPQGDKASEPVSTDVIKQG
ncbi:NADH-quinone oxidoreductase, chain I [Planctopirus limnophila DSM 3776]|uniref:NADH-quinone oxidoreductase subunit I n=1 Tax=Planctopirus limnophila (strain ATCC 43296 / DSM 3776 / IFAM 1008 / Mu 290) TaxID=521674 RepID=D5SX55_PLAL2|nr:NADH-quinone oxidoreductase subunit I [Planctopirus limnophila]ADG69677.1 NADH-quinone oxidoreductase, chain I [Planctopirus limnophila DSM 3776]